MLPDHPLRTIPSLQQWRGVAGSFTFPDRATWHLRVDGGAGPGSEAHPATSRGQHAAPTRPDVALTTDLVATGISELAGPAGVTFVPASEGEAVLRIVVGADVVVPGTDSPEAFTLRVEPDQVRIAARSPRAARWALNSLEQMTESGRVECGVAHDWPNYPVRGFMLDVGRRFVPAPFLHKLIREMGRTSLNTFIVHLNDNEVAKDNGRPWPEVQHAFRLATENPEFAPLAANDGHYTRADWDALEDTAARYGVTLVPEFDAPAHSRSFIAHRPELGLNDGDSDMLDLEKPETHEFMRGLFAEFLPWFRGPGMHFGADEYDKDLPDVFREYFNSIAQFLREQGKEPWAWGSLTSMAGDAPRAEGYNRDVTICSWNNEWYGGRDAIADGFRIVNMNDAHLYLVPFADYYRGEHLDAEMLWRDWEPHVFGDGQDVPAGHPQLLGAMSALWNDLVLLDYDEVTMARMIEPTFALLAQKMWSGSLPGVSLEQFNARVAQLPPFLDGLLN